MRQPSRSSASPCRRRQRPPPTHFSGRSSETFGRLVRTAGARPRPSRTSSDSSSAGSGPTSARCTCWSPIGRPGAGGDIGLAAESVGRVRMRLSEGLVGLVAEKMRPSVVEDATTHPRFKYFPEAGEDLPLVPRRADHRSRAAAGRAGRADGRARASSRDDDVRMLATAGAQVAPIVSEARTLGQFVAPDPPAPVRRWRRTCGGAGTTTRRRSSASSSRSLWRELDHNPIALLRGDADRRSSKSAPRSSRCTAASTTPTGACRST